ncbi:molybdenum cofactor biosynthesis protein B [uncultured Paludibaculum sp.]|uniref:MogA/MoaB family molybdenum cofactor biosynthesis protein n=1 Tax=uncultured Paludibaculum sp. TaxID=1765020 RepID=UPI00374D7687
MSGPALAALCAEQGWMVVHRQVLPDDAEQIRASLEVLSTRCNLILTTGGTGVAARDVTPEATRAVLEKELPGLAELMRTEGLKYTRRAVLSRGLAGTRGQCLIVNVPGSPKGARQSMDAILDLVPHVVDLLAGQTAHAEDTKRP